MHHSSKLGGAPLWMIGIHVNRSKLEGWYPTMDVGHGGGGVVTLYSAGYNNLLCLKFFFAVLALIFAPVLVSVSIINRSCKRGEGTTTEATEIVAKPL